MRSAFALRIDSGIMILICISAKPAELVGAKPLHLLMQTALPLKSPTGAFIAAQTRAFLNSLFTSGVVTVNYICNSDRPLIIAASLVKIAFVAARRPRQTRNKNNLSAEDAQSNAERIQNRLVSPRRAFQIIPLPSCIFGERGVEYSHNQTQGSSCSGLRGSIANFDPFT